MSLNDAAYDFANRMAGYKAFHHTSYCLSWMAWAECCQLFGQSNVTKLQVGVFFQKVASVLRASMCCYDGFAENTFQLRIHDLEARGTMVTNKIRNAQIYTYTYTNTCVCKCIIYTCIHIC